MSTWVPKLLECYDCSEILEREQFAGDYQGQPVCEKCITKLLFPVVKESTGSSRSQKQNGPPGLNPPPLSPIYEANSKWEYKGTPPKEMDIDTGKSWSPSSPSSLSTVSSQSSEASDSTLNSQDLMHAEPTYGKMQQVLDNALNMDNSQRAEITQPTGISSLHPLRKVIQPESVTFTPTKAFLQASRHYTQELRDFLSARSEALYRFRNYHSNK